MFCIHSHRKSPISPAYFSLHELLQGWLVWFLEGCLDYGCNIGCITTPFIIFFSWVQAMVFWFDWGVVAEEINIMEDGGRHWFCNLKIFGILQITFFLNGLSYPVSGEKRAWQRGDNASERVDLSWLEWTYALTSPHI